MHKFTFEFEKCDPFQLTMTNFCILQDRNSGNFFVLNVEKVYRKKPELCEDIDIIDWNYIEDFLPDGFDEQEGDSEDVIQSDITPERLNAHMQTEQATRLCGGWYSVSKLSSNKRIDADVLFRLLQNAEEV